LTVFGRFKLLLKLNQGFNVSARLAGMTRPSGGAALTRRQFACEFPLQRRDFSPGDLLVEPRVFQIGHQFFGRNLDGLGEVIDGRLQVIAVHSRQTLAASGLEFSQRLRRCRGIDLVGFKNLLQLGLERFEPGIRAGQRSPVRWPVSCVRPFHF
jgi:hypothetical protein